MGNKEIIEGILKDNPEGLTIADLSEKMKMNRITIARSLAELIGEGNIHIREVGRAKLHYWKPFMKVKKRRKKGDRK